MPKLATYRNKDGYGHCRIRGCDYYFGRWQKNPPKAFFMLVAEYHETGRLLPRPRDVKCDASSATILAAPAAHPAELTIAELIEKYLDGHVDIHYRRPDGTLTSEVGTIRSALRPLFGAFADMPADAFSARHLIELRERMIDELDWNRKNINDNVSRVRAMFRWALERELIPGTQYSKLIAVRNLAKDRSRARESTRVRGVEAAVRDAVLARCTPMISDMAVVQEDCGGRGQDICSMRWVDIERTDNAAWIYRPPSHKNAWRGQKHVLYIEEAGQAVLRRYEDRPQNAYIFSPARAEDERRQRRHQQRMTPMSCGNVPGSNRTRQPSRAPGEAYTTASYRRALRRAAEIAFPFAQIDDIRAGLLAHRSAGRSRIQVERAARLAQPELFAAYTAWRRQYWWSPHRLRHSAGKRYERVGGLEFNMHRLGHKTISTSLLYDGIDERDVLEKIRTFSPRSAT